jgi:hypothetical protein
MVEEHVAVCCCWCNLDISNYLFVKFSTGKNQTAICRDYLRIPGQPTRTATFRAELDEIRAKRVHSNERGG